MLLRIVVSAFVLAGCSAGSLDLDGKGRQQDEEMWPQMSTSLAEETLINMGDYAEDGVSLFAAGIGLNGRIYSGAPGGIDQILLPASFERPIFRKALSTGTVVASGGRQRTYDCWASTVGALVDETDCAEHAVCGTVVTEVVDRGGPGPCSQADGSYNLRFDSTADKLEISFAETPAVTDLTRVTVAYEGVWAASSQQDAPTALIDPSAVVFGDKVLVFGRSINGVFDGGFFDPGLNKWTPMKKEEMPAGGGTFRSLWTGDKLLVFLASGGAVFDAGANAWRAMKAEGAPALDGQPFAAAYDAESKRAYLYGNGQGGGGTRFSIGAIYDVDGNTWSGLSVDGGPAADAYAGGAWTGNEFLVWSEAEEGRAVFYPQTEQWIAYTDVAGNSVQGSTTEGPSRVFNFDGKVLIVPSGVTYEPGKETPWGRLSEPSWFDRNVAVQFDRSAAIILAGKNDSTPSQYLGLDLGTDFGRNPTAFPRTPSAPPPRSGSAVARLGNHLFVYGGCEINVNDRCQKFSRAGAVAKLRSYGAN